MADFIEIRGLRALGRHGVHDFEKERAQPFEIDLVLQTDLRTAGASDDLTDTVSYSDIVSVTTIIVETGHCDLIEHLAERIATAVLADPRITSAEVTVRKPHAPVGALLRDVGVRIQRP